MPFWWHKRVNSAANFCNIWSAGKWLSFGEMVPASKVDISTKVLMSSSAATKESSRWCRVFASSPLGCCCDKDDENNRAALRGCIKSWLAAAKNRVLLWLAWSAPILARLNRSLATTRALVRSSTRSSRVSLVSFNAASMRLWLVMSM